MKIINYKDSDKKIVVTEYPTLEEMQMVEMGDDNLIIVVCCDMSEEDAFLTRDHILKEYGESERMIIAFTNEYTFEETFDMIEDFSKLPRKTTIPDSIDVIYPRQEEIVV